MLFVALAALSVTRGPEDRAYAALDARFDRGGTSRPVVQFAMLVDYPVAIPTLLTGVLYAAELPAETKHIVCGS